MKRKANPAGPTPNPGLSLTSLDAALDLLVCDTFTRLNALSTKFEAAAGIKLNDGVVKKRWDEAVKRWDVMRSIDDLCCGSSRYQAGGITTTGGGGVEVDGEVKMEEDGEMNGNGRRRPLPNCPHPGAVTTFDLCPDEEGQWRRWSPKLNDVVLVHLADGQKLPGKIIDKKVFFQGRTVPRGNHFFPVRIYQEDVEPVISIKSRMVPLHLRPTPPILASPSLQSAYHHATNPTTFDMLASARESGAAHSRAHPGATDEKDKEKWKLEKESWKKTVSWIMDERRIEKLRALSEEREKRLKEVAIPEDERGIKEESPWSKLSISTKDEEDDFDHHKKRRVGVSSTSSSSPRMNGSTTITKIDSETPSTDRGGIFRVSLMSDDTSPIQTTPIRTASPLASYIRPGLMTPQRPLSPRRLARRLPLDSRSRGLSYTPPRVLPSGDETALNSLPTTSGSPVPTLPKFDFVSPLGPVRFGRLNKDDEEDENMSSKPRNGSLGSLSHSPLPAVAEEREEGDESGFWTTVIRGRKGRAGSAPCREKLGIEGSEASVVVVGGGDYMEL